MSKVPLTPPPKNTAVPSAPPSYDQAMGFGGVPPVSPYVPQQPLIRETRIITTLVPVGDRATHMVCPNCHKEINTATRSEPGLAAWLMGCFCCMVGCFCGCCLIPCCIEELRDIYHSCPNCGAFLGKYNAPVERLRSRPTFVQPNYAFSRPYTYQPQ